MWLLSIGKPEEVRLLSRERKCTQKKNKYSALSVELTGAPRNLTILIVQC